VTPRPPPASDSAFGFVIFAGVDSIYFASFFIWPQKML
jgi:hypothetical protein